MTGRLHHPLRALGARLLLNLRAHPMRLKPGTAARSHDARPAHTRASQARFASQRSLGNTRPSRACADVRACPSANSRPTGAYVAGTRGSGDECGARARPRTTLNPPTVATRTEESSVVQLVASNNSAYGMWLHGWLGPAATPPLHTAHRRCRQHCERPGTADPAAAFPSIPTAASAMLGRPSNTQHTSSYPARNKHMGAQV